MDQKCLISKLIYQDVQFCCYPTVWHMMPPSRSIIEDLHGMLGRMLTFVRVSHCLFVSSTLTLSSIDPTDLKLLEDGNNLFFFVSLYVIGTLKCMVNGRTVPKQPSNYMSRLYILLPQSISLFIPPRLSFSNVDFLRPASLHEPCHGTPFPTG